MEKFSENKRKRGRPEKLRVTVEGSIKDLVKKEHMGHNKTDRTKLNEYYALMAQLALGNGENEEYSYIISSNVAQLNFYIYKKTILIELGRLEDPDLIQEAAMVICENEFNTMKAVTYIRHIRVGDRPAGNNIDLAKAIGNLIDEYCLKHSGVNAEMVLESLNTVLSAVPEKLSNNTENIDN